MPPPQTEKHLSFVTFIDGGERSAVASSSRDCPRTPAQRPVAELSGGLRVSLPAITATRKHTKAEIRALVAQLKNIVTVLADADADDKRAIYAELGVNLTYHLDGRIRVGAGARVLGVVSEERAVLIGHGSGSSPNCSV